MSCLIGKDQNDPEFRCYPYRKSLFRQILMIITYILSAGFMWLIFYWRPDWKLKFTHYMTSFDDCTSIYLEDLDGTQRVYVSKICFADASLKKWAPHLFARSPDASQLYFKNAKVESYRNGHLKEASLPTSTVYSVGDGGLVKYFIHNLAKYVWDDNVQTFVKVEGYDRNVNLGEVHMCANNPISKNNAELMRELYGQNVIHVEIPSYIHLLIAEVLNPFYIFQIFACTLWLVDEYYAYSVAILITSCISAIVSLITIRRERVTLHNMVEDHNSARISVVRSIKDRTDISSTSSRQGGVVPKEYVTEDIWIKDLVPGDVVAIPSFPIQLSFDAALISGSCIVNESMLTGESVPVTKTSLPSGDSELTKTLVIDEQKSHVLFCGTEIVQTRYYQDEKVLAVVVRTGYGTAKGQLVHSILFPKPVNLKLLRDAYKFVAVLIFVSLIGFAFSAYIAILNGLTGSEVALRSLDIITIAVPPALPLALSIGIIYAQNRLKRSSIHTISPQRINICGQIDVVAFDKTGTLTEDGLNLSHIVPASSANFNNLLRLIDLKTWDKRSDFMRCMATCHSLTVIDGETSGDPLDLKMFEATGFELVEPKVDETAQYDQLHTTIVRPKAEGSERELGGKLKDKTQVCDEILDSMTEYEIGIVRIFPFLSSLQRASVIVKSLSSEPKDMLVYVKGAPETIAGLCITETIPEDFMDILKSHTEKGYRVIALSFKSMKMKWLKAQKIEREFVEKDLTFLGFIIFQNKLKPTSEGVINQLDNALIRSVMVTGDNLETAVCVGRDCKILKPGRTIIGVSCDVSGTYPSLKWYRLDNGKSKLSMTLSSSEELSKTTITMEDTIVTENCHLVVTGSEFAVIRKYFPQFVEALAVQGAIFARMSPTQKTELVEELEALEYHTLMCGDGANDCGALKRAHVGLSLSELEASVAAPFTAKIDNGINSVVTLIREGRAALTTSFGMFKFMALYSMIQFTTILLLYINISRLANYQFLYIDLIVIDFTAITMSRNHAYKYLHSRKPSPSLVSLEMMVSLLLQIFLQMGLQIFVFVLVQRQCWYRHPILANISTGEIIHEDMQSDSGHDSTSVSDCPALTNADNVTSFYEDTPKTYETTALFYLSCFMYMSVSVAFSQGKPFRTAIYKNRWLLGSLLLLSGFNLFMMFGAPLEFNEFMDLWRIPDVDFLLVLCGIVATHLVISLLIERFFIENPYLWNKIKSFCSCTKFIRKKRYKNIENYIRNGAGEPIALPEQFEGQIVYSKIPIESQDATGEVQTQL